MGKRRTINPDHIRDRNVPAPETEVIATRLQELLSNPTECDIVGVINVDSPVLTTFLYKVSELIG